LIRQSRLAVLSADGQEYDDGLVLSFDVREMRRALSAGIASREHEMRLSWRHFVARLQRQGQAGGCPSRMGFWGVRPLAINLCF
jgi:hypothetical protein